MLIRRERADDAAAIAAVHRSAFGPQYANGDASTVDLEVDNADPPEVDLVARLRSDSGWIPTLSLVAIEYDLVIGHLCLTRAGVGPFPVLALGPIGVTTNHQGNGVGSALMHAALGAADALDEPLVGVLGSLDFYPQFGFVPAARLGVVPDEPTWATHFQVRPLTAYESPIIGEFHYAEPFYNDQSTTNNRT
ncbi:GNAT family N-acetyltransferase [Nocardia australiensis]|uniref:GNAT family N-acetyltransferase n=1 Tax=Nocardia australiensis TaxID=2887191 RepID=UPI001D13D8D2|nr:N-acetyltransferase [Nocardia australiensis]